MKSPDDPRSWLSESGDDELLERIAHASSTRPGLRVGHYADMVEVARGGQGIVYRARDTTTGRSVALKRLHAFPDDEATRRFERELDALRALSHENIVRVVGLELHEGVPFLVLEWIEGRSALDWARRGDGGVTRTLELVARVCDAVQAAHDSGFLHRDLKPSNVLVDAQDVPHVLDFGIAKRLGRGGEGDGPATLTSGFVGTEVYAAPERWSDPDHAEPTTDVWSLGVLAFELLTGTLPFDLRGGWERRRLAMIHEDLPRPSSRNAELSRDLDAVVLKALRARPGERYATVRELGDELRRVLAGEPVRARLPGAGRELRRRLRRYRFAAVVLLAVVTSSVAIAVQGWVAAERIAEERDDARRANEASGALLDYVVDGLIVPLDPLRGGAAGDAERGLLDRAAKWLDELDGTPTLRDELRTQLATVYLHLNEAEEADRLAEAVLAANGPGANDELRLRAGLVRARSLVDRGRVQDASEVVEEFARTENEWSPALRVRLLSMRGELEFELGRFHEAEAHMREVYETHAARQPRSGAASTAAINLARTLLFLKRIEEAEALFSECVEQEGDRLPAVHPTRAQIAAGLGRCAMMRGDWTAAVEHFQRAAEIESRVFAGPSPLLGDVLVGLAEGLLYLGEPGRAEERLLEARAALDELHGPDHPGQSVVSTQLVATRIALGYYEKAEEDYQQAVSILETSEPTALDHATTLYQGGRVALRLGRTEEARERWRQSLEILRDELDEPFVQAMVARELGYEAKRRRSLEEAEEYFREAVECALSYYDRTHPKVALLLGEWGGLEVDLGRTEEGIAHLRESLELYRQQPQVRPTDLAQTLLPLGFALLRASEVDEARACLREVVAVVEPNGPMAQHMVCDARIGLAMCLDAEGRRDEARAELAEQQTEYRREYGASHPCARSVKNALVRFEDE